MHKTVEVLAVMNFLIAIIIFFALFNSNIENSTKILIVLAFIAFDAAVVRVLKWLYEK